MAMGTVAYCAPEQLSGDEVDGRADQYALAATAYQLLTGEPLFPNSDPAVVIDDHLNSKPPTLAAQATGVGRTGSGAGRRAGQAARRSVRPLLGLRARPEREDRGRWARATARRPAELRPDRPAGDTFADRYTEPLTVDPRAVAGPSPSSSRRAGRGGGRGGGRPSACLRSGRCGRRPTGPTHRQPATHVDHRRRPVEFRCAATAPRRDPARATPSGACTPADVPQAAVAKVRLHPEHRRRRPASVDVHARSRTTPRCRRRSARWWATCRVVNCPGNIQSPGAWRRNATPQQVSGTLVCGFRGGVPTLAWTDDAKLMLSLGRRRRERPQPRPAVRVVVEPLLTVIRPAAARSRSSRGRPRRTAGGQRRCRGGRAAAALAHRGQRGALASGGRGALLNARGLRCTLGAGGTGVIGVAPGPECPGCPARAGCPGYRPESACPRCLPAGRRPARGRPRRRSGAPGTARRRRWPAVRDAGDDDE